MTDFKQLITTIENIHTDLRRAAVGTVNRMHTYRNWLIGMYIVEYEQSGKDRAEYGTELIKRIALQFKNHRGFSIRNLNLFREFYLSYPQIAQVISDLPELKFSGHKILQSLTAKLQPIENEENTTITPAPESLVRHFSFTHFVELMRIDDLLKRTFYEIEGIKGCWSVSQLKRQIESLLYERTGMSSNKGKVTDIANKDNNPVSIDDMIRDPYILEFTGLPERASYSENDLETALIDHVQSFLLELGNGFCFEARQKRITLDNEHDRIDLVFYHRILRCHVLIDLKVRKFRHGDAGQMNFYLNYFRENIMNEGDSPPVGLILCTDRDETRVRYATTGIDNQMFVSKYMTALPSENMIRSFLEKDRDRTENILRERHAEYSWDV